MRLKKKIRAHFTHRGTADTYVTVYHPQCLQLCLFNISTLWRQHEGNANFTCATTTNYPIFGI